MSILDELKALDTKRQELLTRAKTEALKAAERAVSELNDLGFSYRLVEGGGTARATNTDTGTGARRSGVSKELLDLLKSSTTGLNRAAILEQMSATDKAHQNTISTALSNLKKAGKITADNGVYKAA